MEQFVIKSMSSRNFLAILFILMFSSCKDFIDTDPPKNSLVPESVFQSNDLATSAMLGVYQQMSLTGFSSGNEGSVSTICGVAADEFIGYDVNLSSIYNNQYDASTARTNDVWNTAYKRIFDLNTILLGLEKSTEITPDVKSRLKGEALFVRAFCYFYLVNVFGAVPLHLTPNYSINSTATRTSVNEVYLQIIKDLKTAEELLDDAYPTTERVRPNKATVQALMARAYLFMGEWQNASQYATFIIEREATYKLVGLNDIFLKNSLETIWQLMPAANSNTPAGNLLILTTTPVYVSLRNDFVNTAFEVGDQRKTAWVKSVLVGNANYFYPFKYKIKTSTTVSEYYTVFRLAEQFLIRAEARARLNNLPGAIDDLDAIRKRAGLLLVKNLNPGINQESLLTAIQKERRIELFSEWGDRWLDLKRNNKLAEVLMPIKPNWKSFHQLFPIPKAEIDGNKLITQNEGYQ